MKPDEWVGRIEELSVVATDAREVLGELRSELREARKVIREMREMRDSLLKELVDERLKAEVQAGLAEYGETLRTAMAEAVAHIEAEFDKLFTAYMKGNRRDHNPDLRDLLGGS